MCIFGGGGGGGYTPPPRPPAAPRQTSEGVRAARADEKRRQRIAAGRSSTIKTSGDLLGEANTTGNLLGS